jgi:hypothetical protein
MFMKVRNGVKKLFEVKAGYWLGKGPTFHEVVDHLTS